MNREALSSAMAAARREIFRLEVQQSYEGVPDPGWTAWRAGAGLAPLDEQAEQWQDAVAARAEAGVLQHRVLVVDEPIHPYLHYEFAAFTRHVASGERILVALRGADPRLDGLTEDFWMVDEEFVAVMTYDAEHRPLGPRAPTQLLGAYRAQRDLALRHATPLLRWMNEHQDILTA